MNLDFAIGIVLAEIEKYYPPDKWDELRSYGYPSPHVIVIEAIVGRDTDTDKQNKKRYAAAKLYGELCALQEKEQRIDAETVDGDLVLSLSKTVVTFAYYDYAKFLDAEEKAKLKGALDED